ncbi:uncharacterized protein LOC135212451 [Macrobrachium nipponense]|uniref:uncharacterized protein LOC135212451 n=1 Tax=Macrobrachium nipponense TaxID=159736 RepID=UPI0030C8700C
MVQNKIDGLPAVKLIEVNTRGDGLVENQFYDGSVSTFSEGYLFNSDEVSGTFDSERKFYLVEYDSGTFSNVPDRCGVAYVTFTGYKFELYWVSNESYVVRGLAYGDEDITVGNETCVSSNPCYMEVNKRDEDVNICKEINNTAPIGGTLEQCEDQTPLTPSDLEEDPGLLLIDNSNLTLRYTATSNLNYNTNARFEVLALNMDGHMMSKDQTFVCEENVVGGCSLNVTLPDESALVDFIIVSIASNKTLLESKSHVFENVPLDTWYLTEDAVIADWTQGENETFLASIRIKSDLDNDRYLLDHSCESSSCEYFFIIADNEKSEYLAVISNGTDAVAKTIVKGPPDTSTIKKISKSVISDNSGSTTFTVNGAESVPSRAKLVEVSGSDEAVVNILYDGNVNVGDSSITVEDSSAYEFITSDNISFVGERKFLLVEYDDEKVTRAAPAYVTFVEVAVDLVWINDTTILRGRVHDDIDVSIGDEICNKSISPCYHSALPPDVQCVPLCVQAANRAKGLEDKFVGLCEDEEPDISNGLTVKKLQLQEDEGEDRGNITLSAACIEGSDRVGLALFSAGKPLNIKDIECIKMSNTTCESSSVPLTESSQSLDIVVVCTSGENVTASGHINVDHLKFNVSKLDDSSIVVYWTAANAEEYIATLEEVHQGTLLRMAGKSSSEILCDSEDSCYSTFFDLDPNTNYQLSVHKEGDNSSSTGTNIEPLKDQVSASTILITKVSRVDDHTTKVYLAEKCDHDQVNILVKVPPNEDNPTDVSGEGMETDFTHKIFEFSHDISIFDKKHADFTVLDKKNDILSGTGTARLTLKKLDVKVAWVGADKFNSGASLRVDVGSQDKVNLGNLICEKESSPCYFLELEYGDYPEDFERCVDVTEKIKQCDEEVTPFTAMDQKDVNITLEDNVLEVVATLSESEAKIELKVYDPSNPETVFSEGNVTCKNMMEDKDLLCTQPVGLPNGQSDLKVMVTEISSKGIALKSVILIVDVPAASTGAASWVIAVSVLSALIITAIGSYLIVVNVKKKKSRDWESNAIAEQVEAIDNIYSEIDPSQGNQKPHMPSRENSDSTSESSITLPERQISSQRPHTPDRRQDYFSERPFSRGRAPIPLASRGGFPDGRFSHSQSPNELLDRRPPIYPKPQLGHRNKAFVSSESDGIGDLQPIRQQKVQLSSKINLSSFQKMAGYQQSRI